MLFFIFQDKQKIFYFEKIVNKNFISTAIRYYRKNRYCTYTLNYRNGLQTSQKLRMEEIKNKLFFAKSFTFFLVKWICFHGYAIDLLILFIKFC